jgi:protease-4
MKKHPILTVLAILAVVIIFLGLLMTALQEFPGRPTGIPFSNKIGVIQIKGVIRDSGEILNQLITFRKDRGIKGIILRIDSPGGGVGASQEIYREVLKTREEKKVIVSMGGVAASGGYYIASAGDKIMANPGTMTGSIGVIMEFYQFKELAEKIGVGLEVIKSGEFKDVGSSYREPTEREKELLTSFVKNIHEQFINAVATGRNLSVEKVREIADGRILSGEMAKDLGLIDHLGNFQDAVDLTKSLVGIEGDANLVFPQKPSFRLWDLFFKEASETMSQFFYKQMTGSIEYRWKGFSKEMS